MLPHQFSSAFRTLASWHWWVEKQRGVLFGGVVCTVLHVPSSLASVPKFDHRHRETCRSSLEF